MPRFYFHYREGDDLLVDEEGRDLADVEQARREAERAGLEILAEKVMEREYLNHDQIEIVDEAGLILATVRLSDLLKRSP